MNFFDDFERPNGSLGSPWIFGGAGTWAIVNGKATHTSGAGFDAAIIDFSEADVNVITPLSGVNTGQCVRYIDINNTLMVVGGVGPTADGLWKIVSGVSTRIMPTVAIPGNAVLETLCVANTIRISSNDVILGTYIMTSGEAAQFTTPTKFGLRAFSNQQQAHTSFSVLKYIGNIEIYPADVNIDTAISGFGLNLGSQAFSRWAYDKAKIHGATEIRWQFGWEFCETAPGVYGGTQLKLVIDTFKWCSDLGLKPLIVAGYAPPRTLVQKVHVNGSHPIGSTSLTVIEDISGIILEVGSHFIGAPGLGLGKASYYGGIIIDFPLPNTIMLGAATTGVIQDGTELNINRLMYPSISTNSGEDPSAVAFANYAHALALLIFQNCPEGGAVELWNEPPWANDLWDKRAQFYDDPAAHGVANWTNALSPIIKAVAGKSWPTNVEVYSSATHKSGGHSALNVASKEALFPIVADEYHPYDVEPEVYWWGRGPTCVGTNWGVGYRNLVGASSFAAGAKIADEAGFRRRISECGYGGVHPDPDWYEGMSSYSIRKLVGAWSMGYEMVNFYSLTDAPYPMVNSTTHESYLSLVRIGQFMGFLRKVKQELELYIRPNILFYEGELPLFRVNIGPILVCWQRSPAGSAPDYKPQWPEVQKVRIKEESGFKLMVLNSVRRGHESNNVGPSGERTLYFGAEPLVVTWKNA